jgi:hypothetical protein
MKRTRWRLFYPRSWRERYGEEFDQLLEDLEDQQRFAPGTVLNVAAAGIRLHPSRADGRRRLVAAAAVVAFGASGVVVGLRTSSPTTTLTAGSFVAPMLPLYRPLGPPLSDAQLTFDLNVQCGSKTLPIVPFAAGHTSGIAWSIAVPRTAPGGPLLLDRLAYGTLTLAGVSVPLCQLLNLAVRFAATDHGAIFGATFGIMNIGSRALAYGLVPDGDKVVIRGLGSATRPVAIRRGISGYSLFLATFQTRLCGDVMLHLQGSSPQVKWTGESRFNSSGCSSGLPIQPVGSGTTLVGIRNSGEVARISNGTVFVTTPSWPVLRVHLTSSTRLYLETKAGESPLPKSYVIRGGDFVYVSGLIGPTSAHATALYISTPESERAG